MVTFISECASRLHCNPPCRPACVPGEQPMGTLLYDMRPHDVPGTLPNVLLVDHIKPSYMLVDPMATLMYYSRGCHLPAYTITSRPTCNPMCGMIPQVDLHV